MSQGDQSIVFRVNVLSNGPGGWDFRLLGLSLYEGLLPLPLAAPVVDLGNW